MFSKKVIFSICTIVLAVVGAFTFLIVRNKQLQDIIIDKDINIINLTASSLENNSLLHCLNSSIQNLSAEKKDQKKFLNLEESDFSKNIDAVNLNYIVENKTFKVNILTNGENQKLDLVVLIHLDDKLNYSQDSRFDEIFNNNEKYFDKIISQSTFTGLLLNYAKYLKRVDANKNIEVVLVFKELNTTILDESNYYSDLTLIEFNDKENSTNNTLKLNIFPESYLFPFYKTLTEAEINTILYSKDQIQAILDNFSDYDSSSIFSDEYENESMNSTTIANSNLNQEQVVIRLNNKVGKESYFQANFSPTMPFTTENDYTYTNGTTEYSDFTVINITLKDENTFQSAPQLND